MIAYHDPMDVSWEAADDEMVPSPGCDPRWDDLTKLRWLAGCIEAEHEFRIQVVTGITRIVWPPTTETYYGYKMKGRKGGAFTFDQMWHWLGGFNIGLDEGISLGFKYAEEE